MSENAVSQLQCTVFFCTEKQTSTADSLRPSEKGLLEKATR